MKQGYSSQTQRLVLMICALVSGVGFIDSTALNVALPFIQRDLGADAASTYWVLEIYLLGLAALTMAGGALGDSFGRRRPLRWGTLFFGITSVGCALSTSAEMLIFFRALQGIAAAVMIPASLALINASFASEDRGAAIGKWSALVSLTIPLGPLVGGISVDLAAWPVIFWINVPICGLVLYLLHDLPAPPFEPDESVPLDIKGSAAITLALGLVTYALMEAGRVGEFALSHLATGLAGIGLLLYFIRLQYRQPHPMIPPHLFQNRRFVIVNLHTMLLFAAFQGATFFLSFLLVQSYGYGATAAGAAALPISVLVTLLSRRAGAWTSRYGPKHILLVSSLLMALAFFLFSLTDGRYWQSLFIPMVILGFGVAAFAAPVTTVAMVSAGKGRDGLASGVNNAVARIGPLLGIAAMGYVLSVRFEAEILISPAFLDLADTAQNYILAHLNELGGMQMPQDWPPALQEEAQMVVADAFATSIATVMQLCGGLMILCAALCLVYRAEDATA